MDSECEAEGPLRDELKKMASIEDQIAMIEGRVKWQLGEAEVQGVLPDGGYWSWKADKNGRRRLYYRGPK